MKILHWITKKKKKGKLVKSKCYIFHSRLFLTRLQIFVICITCGVLRFKKILVNVYLKTDLILQKEVCCLTLCNVWNRLWLSCFSVHQTLSFVSFLQNTLVPMPQNIPPPSPLFFLLYYHENVIFWLNEKCLLFWLTQSSMTKTSLTQMCPRTSVQRILSITNDSVCLSSGKDVSKSP